MALRYVAGALMAMLAASTSISPIQVPDIDLDHSIVFESVRDRLQYLQGIANHVKTLPSCSQLATSALLHTCSALEGSFPHDEGELKRGSDLFVDEEADIYSARLAVCELNSADFPVPDECRSFIPSVRGNKKRGIRGFWPKHDSADTNTVFQYYEEVTQANLKQCRKALGASTQAWTSYSNNRQNAHLYCRAVRSEIEKDDQLHVGKVLAKTAVSASESLQDAFEQFSDLKAEFSKLATAMPQFQMDLAAGNQQQMEHIQRFWSELERAREGLQDIATGVNDIRQGVQYANDDIVGLGAVVGESAAEVQGSLAALRSHLTYTTGDVETLSQLISYKREKQQQEFLKGLGAITNDISVVNNLMTIHQQALWEEREATDRWLRHRIEKETEYQNLQQEMAATLMETSHRAREVNSTLASLPSLIGFSWAPVRAAFETTATLVAYTSIYALLSFGMWERFVGFSFIGNLFASVGSGLCLACISVFTHSPLDLCHAILNTATLTDNLKVLTIGALLGMALSLLLLAGLSATSSWRVARIKASIVAHADRCVEYDPLSPCYDPQQSYHGHTSTRDVSTIEKWTV